MNDLLIQYDSIYFEKLIPKAFGTTTGDRLEIDGRSGVF